MVATSLPLFPLGAVLFPGIPLPLHIFEDRYRRLVRDLVDRPAGQRRFGVIAIRAGREVGVDGVDDLHPVGCAAELVRVQAYPDGRFDIIAVGVARFRLAELHVGDLAHGDVEFLAEKTSDRSPALAATAGRVFTRYRASVLTAQGTPPDEDPHLPDRSRSAFVSHRRGKRARYHRQAAAARGGHRGRAAHPRGRHAAPGDPADERPRQPTGGGAVPGLYSPN